MPVSVSTLALELKKFRVHVEGDLGIFGSRPRNLNGRCTELAVKYLAEHYYDNRLSFVEGFIGREEPFLHSWVELPGDIVFDGTFWGFFYDRDAYYRITNARPAVRLSQIEAQEAFLRKGENGAYASPEQLWRALSA